LPLNKAPVKLGQPKTKAIISDMNTKKIKAKTGMDKSSAKSSKKSSKGVHNSK
jgi:hypothetical protein